MLGVALLVALLGTPSSPADAHDQLTQVWLMAAVAGVTCSAIALLLLRRARA